MIGFYDFDGDVEGSITTTVRRISIQPVYYSTNPAHW